MILAQNTVLTLVEKNYILMCKKGYTVTKYAVERLLKKADFERQSGGRHDIWKKVGFPPIPVPRHKGDIPRGTLKSILKSSGIEQ